LEKSGPEEWRSASLEPGTYHARGVDGDQGAWEAPDSVTLAPGEHKVVELEPADEMAEVIVQDRSVLRGSDYIVEVLDDSVSRSLVTRSQRGRIGTRHGRKDDVRVRVRSTRFPHVVTETVMRWDVPSGGFVILLAASWCEKRSIDLSSSVGQRDVFCSLTNGETGRHAGFAQQVGPGQFEVFFSRTSVPVLAVWERGTDGGNQLLGWFRADAPAALGDSVEVRVSVAERWLGASVACQPLGWPGAQRVTFELLARLSHREAVLRVPGLPCRLVLKKGSLRWEGKTDSSMKLVVE